MCVGDWEAVHMYGCHPEVSWQALVMALVERYWAIIAIMIFDSRRRSNLPRITDGSLVRLERGRF